MKIDKKGLLRFARYGLVGGSTFLLDLLILYFLVEKLYSNYLLATGLAFFFSVSLNYAISRKIIFKSSSRNAISGYFYFLVFAAGGIAGTLAGMAILVGFFGLNYLLARGLVSAIIGMLNYILNLYFNFKVYGIH